MNKINLKPNALYTVNINHQWHIFYEKQNISFNGNHIKFGFKSDIKILFFELKTIKDTYDYLELSAFHFEYNMFGFSYFPLHFFHKSNFTELK